MRSEPTIVSETHGPVFVIRINNPKQKNSLNAEVLEALALQVEASAAREDIAAIVFTGAADVFASGADINELSRLTPASAAASVPPVVPPPPSVPARAGLAVYEGSPGITTFVYDAAPATGLPPCATSVYDAAGRLLSVAEPADPSGGKRCQLIIRTKGKK